ncbi:hypothetical protein [Paracoccus methylarcula]|uniref:hypothetical protein n=1 Tax=Paracoccus methylarcula TaxID=72022 RepID=UPI00147518D4|nr:hypothetical protein [Paracoccus methylarcula]
MNTAKPLMRPSDIRKAVAEWCAMGLAVKVEPDGTMTVVPKDQQDTIAADLIQWAKK